MASDFLLKLEGVDGESTVADHPGAIEIESWSWGETNVPRAGGGGGGAGKVSMQDFHFVAKTSKASPILFLRCATGQHIKEAKLFVRKAGERPLEYYIVTLKDVLITSYGVAGEGGGANPGGTSNTVPTDTFSINFTQIIFEYKPQKADGSLDTAVKAGYDIKTNKKV